MPVASVNVTPPQTLSSRSASVGDMGSVWQMASRLHLCQLPIRFRQCRPSQRVRPSSTSMSASRLSRFSAYKQHAKHDIRCTGPWCAQARKAAQAHLVHCSATATAGVCPCKDLQTVEVKPHIHTWTRGTHLLLYAGTQQQPQSTKSSQVVQPPKLGGAEIRERFLQYYTQHQHTRLPSSSLIPDDPTVLLTIAGMLQFKAIFMGQVQYVCIACHISSIAGQCSLL